VSLLNVIVTGGTKGLGLAIAIKLAAQSFRVIAIARSESDEFRAHAAGLNAATPGCLHFCPYDLTDLDGIPSLVAGITRQHGALYGLVNNAGIGTSGILATMPEKQIAALLHLNVASPIALTRHAVRAMMVGGGGRIINMSSIVASTGYSGLSVYAATKAALTGFTRSLARELGPLGITVNSIAPGFIDTDMTHHMQPADKARIAGRSALKRLAGAEDVAGAVQYLLSDQARNITAITLTVDAGNTA
jgi:3-oxoacyl-[acyl-carrier protein] reductase